MRYFMLIILAMRLEFLLEEVLNFVIDLLFDRGN